MSFENKRRSPLVDQTKLSDLEWLAFQYLSDELTSQQRGEFEEVVSTDPAAAEALQAMVAVTHELLMAGELPADQPSLVAESRPARKTNADSAAPARTVRWLAALAAGLLLLVGGSQLLAPKSGDSKGVNEDAHADGDQMAEFWASSFEDELTLPNDRDESQASTAGEAEFATGAATEETSESDAAEEGWLYSALVSLESTEDWPTEGQGGS